MSALDELKSKSKIERTQLEWAILVCDEFGGEATAMDAAAELAALREWVEKLEASNARLFDDLHNQIHQTVGAEMERDELREQVADVNELLYEFAENPNIELGEKGHNKIEDYFKKYDRQEAQ